MPYQRVVFSLPAPKRLPLSRSCSRLRAQTTMSRGMNRERPGKRYDTIRPVAQPKWRSFPAVRPSVGSGVVASELTTTAQRPGRELQKRK